MDSSSELIGIEHLLLMLSPTNLFLRYKLAIALNPAQYSAS